MSVDIEVECFDCPARGTARGQKSKSGVYDLVLPEGWSARPYASRENHVVVRCEKHSLRPKPYAWNAYTYTPSYTP
jgi:hypothetical protein